MYLHQYLRLRVYDRKICRNFIIKSPFYYLSSWYFGPLSREEANNLLLAERDSGIFLVRDSNSIKGDFVLCVRYVISCLLSPCYLVSFLTDGLMLDLLHFT